MEAEEKIEVVKTLQKVTENSFWGDSLSVSLLISLIILCFVLLYVASIYHQLLKSKIPGAYPAKKIKVKIKQESELIKALTDYVPVEEEHTILMDHEYDGIQELDNNLPPWWKYGFYITIVWAFIYFAHYHVMGLGSSSADEYKNEVVAAEIAKQEYLKTAGEIITADNVTYKSDAMSLAKGENVFSTNCKTCHGAAGQGDAGPNLTDQNWINGGDIKSIFTLVSNGKKAMPSWASLLSPSDIQLAISYVHSLQGTNPANAKAPEGELYKGEVAKVEVDSVAVDTSVVK